ncbi:MAG: septum formation protein Maf [Chloroflexi bacterium RBG_16_48_8]|nr:MAG: septum formation protein Maf [Chloroflexi bacterium RBG_16_48_8]
MIWLCYNHSLEWPACSLSEGLMLRWMLENGSYEPYRGDEIIKGERSVVDFKLASGSPRRQELLEIAGWRVSIHPVTIEEKPLQDEDPENYAKRLACEKAEKVANEDGMIVVGADTIVIHENRILGKPQNKKLAAEMLKELQGKVHRVVTAIALVDRVKERSLVDTCETDVPMRKYSQGEIEAYIASGSPLDKAGAYGIQDGSFRPVDLDEMVGCFANVMGLPLCHLARALRRLGIETPERIYERCMAHTKYHCQVYRDILQREI